MKANHIFSTVLVICSTAFGMYEERPITGIGVGLNAVTAAPLEGVFAVNPANYRFDTDASVFVAADGNFATSGAYSSAARGMASARWTDTNGVLGGIGFSGSYYALFYTGLIVDPVWNEIELNGVYAYKFGPFGFVNNITLGIGLNVFGYTTPYDSAFVFDADAGVHMMFFDALLLGVSGNNLFVLDGSLNRTVNSGIAVVFKSFTGIPLMWSYDFAYSFSEQKWTMRTGLAYKFIPEITIAAGTSMESDFTFSPSAGVAVTLWGMNFTYGFRYNFLTGGFGSHYLGLSRAFS